MMLYHVGAGLSRRLGLQRKSSGVNPLLHTYGAEAAGGEVVERLESANQFDAGYTAFTVEGAQKVGGGALALAGVAFAAGRDPVAARGGAEVAAGDDRVDARHLRCDAAAASK